MANDPRQSAYIKSGDVYFSLSIAGKEVDFVISAEALGDHFGADRTAPLDAFRAHFGTIEKKAIEAYGYASRQGGVAGRLVLQTSMF